MRTRILIAVLPLAVLLLLAVLILGTLLAVGGGHQASSRHPVVGGRTLINTAFPPSTPPNQWCATGFKDPYGTPPTGAVVVPAGDNSNEPFMHSWTVTPNVTYWFAPGTHTLGNSEYASIGVGPGDVFMGAPGAVLNGEGVNNYAFTSNSNTPMTTLDNATIEYLTITGFQAGDGEMVVGQGGYDGWTIKYNLVTGNPYGAGVALANNALVEDNCLSKNGQYGYSSLGGSHHIVFVHNDVYDNNNAGYYDIPGSTVQCGCSGGGKFWMTKNVRVTFNYIHGNIGTGVWVDTDNAGFDISHNYISDNWSSAIAYEISYNGQMTYNTIIGNSYGDVTQNTSPSFPAATIYISESSNRSNVSSNWYNEPLLVKGNALTNNWGGIVLYQNGDRVCGFSADGTCTLPKSSTYTLSSCKTNLENETQAQALAQTPDYYDNCRWKTANVLVENNTINFTPSQLQTGPLAGTETCAQANANGDTYCGYNGLFSTYSSIKPYMGATEPLAISDQQNNTFQDNTYRGPIGFVAFDQGDIVSWAQWTQGFTDSYSHDPFKAQDQGSTYSG